MSDFSTNFTDCMTGKSLPAPILESASNVLEFLHQMHTAIEASVVSPEMTVEEFVPAAIAAGYLSPALAEGIIGGAEIAGEVLVSVFIAACIACLSSAAGASIYQLFAENPPEPFVRDELARIGVFIPEQEEGTAVG